MTEETIEGKAAEPEHVEGEAQPPLHYQTAAAAQQAAMKAQREETRPKRAPAVQQAPQAVEKP